MELVVVLVPRLDLLASGVVGIRVELAQYGRAGNREREIGCNSTVVRGEVVRGFVLPLNRKREEKRTKKPFLIQSSNQLCLYFESVFKTPGEIISWPLNIVCCQL